MKINTLPHEVLLEACVSNGVSRDEFIERGDRIERLELMLTGLPQKESVMKLGLIGYSKLADDPAAAEKLCEDDVEEVSLFLFLFPCGQLD